MLTKEVISKLSDLYDEYYNKADILWKNHPLCQFKDGICRDDKNHEGEGDKRNGCCGSKWDLTTGKWLSESSCVNHKLGIGCTVKCIRCKFFMCALLRRIDEEFWKELNRIHEEFRAQYLTIYSEEEPYPCYFQSKEIWLRRLNIKRRCDAKRRAV